MSQPFESARTILARVTSRYMQDAFGDGHRAQERAQRAIIRRLAEFDLLDNKPWTIGHLNGFKKIGPNGGPSQVDVGNDRMLPIPVSFWVYADQIITRSNDQSQANVVQDWTAGRFSIYDRQDYLPYERMVSLVEFNAEFESVMQFPSDVVLAATARKPGFEDCDIERWIQSAGYTDMKSARSAFMAQPGARGLSASFDAKWKALFPRGPGRPRLGKEI